MILKGLIILSLIVNPATFSGYIVDRFAESVTADKIVSVKKSSMTNVEIDRLIRELKAESVINKSA